jgi:hypothetical protein
MSNKMNDQMIDKFMNEFDFHSFFCFCELLTDENKNYSSVKNMIVSYLKERCFANCLNQNSSFKITHVDEQGRDFVVRVVFPYENQFSIELKTSKKITNKNGKIGSSGKIKMSNYRGNVDFDNFMQNINNRINSDVYIFLDTTRHVVLWATKNDIVNDKSNWISSGDGVVYQLKESSSFINRKDIKLNMVMMFELFDKQTECFFAQIEKLIDAATINQIDLIKNSEKGCNDKTISSQNLFEISRREEQSTQDSFSMDSRAFR